MNCHICDNKLDQKLQTDIDTKVCKACRKQNLFISYTRAKKEFKLNDDDLVSLFSYQVRTGIYGRMQNITLYVLKEVEEASFKKYNCKIEDINKEKKLLAEKLQKERERLQKEREEQENLLKLKRSQQIEKLFNDNRQDIYLTPELLNYIDYGYKFSHYYNKSINNDKDLINAVYIAGTRNKRNVELTTFLEKKNIIINSHFPLVTEYIEGGIEKVKSINKNINNIFDIVDHIEEYNFFYNLTDYKKILDKVYKNINALPYGRRPSYDEIIDFSKIKTITKYIENKNDIDLIPDKFTEIKNKIINKEIIISSIPFEDYNLTTAINYEHMKQINLKISLNNDSICIFCNDLCSKKSFSFSKYNTIRAHFTQQPNKLIAIYSCDQCFKKHNSELQSGKFIAFPNNTIIKIVDSFRI